MTFLQPMMLWSFLAIIPLTAFYFLKVRPRRKPTTAFFLWERVFEEKRSSSLFQRFRDVWSLLLMLLAFSAVCLALARPQWTDRRRDVLILVDNSASMSAREGSSSRLEEAKRTATEIVEGLNGSQRAAVATIGHVLTYKSHLTDNPRELIDAVESIGPSKRSLRLDALPRREDEQNRWDREHRVLLLSDGGFDTASLPEHIELLKIGESQENVGLVAADMSYLPGGANRLGFYFQVASSFKEPCDVDLTLVRVDDDSNEQLFKVIPLQVKPGVNPPETFTLEDALPGRWIARLDLDDALSTDNTANLVAAKPEPIRVAVDSSDRFFLENSIIAFERGDKLLTLVDERPAMVLAKSKTPPMDFALIFQPAGESCWWSDLGDEVEVGVPRVVVADHPALRYLDVGSMAFVGARRLTPPPGAQVLVADERGLPLIYKARHKQQAAIIVNLDPSA
ncbi:MAG: BatA and WFA domain-containing protein, partial [Pirellulales bacterium]|nr:BatA and WFA domain-containing protein [Pirellulales bacterium]